ncbi:hypothetical protein TWF718_007515 [Orbilia javanica]|uniref:Uncharacterized protein n=1 Tax=Orbilia javanica TaxID=47235 RepID=A0AAN8MRK3_9PEZI
MVQEGQYIVYALGASWEGSLCNTNTLLYARVIRVKEDENLIEIELRSDNRLTLTIENDPNRIQVLPNSARAVAEKIIQEDDIEQLKKTLETVFGIGATVTAAAAPGLAGGAALMSGLATIGAGSAVCGIVLVAGAPVVLAGNTLRKVIKRHENSTVTNVAVGAGMATGGTAGSFAAIGLVSAAGPVAGLSGAGITSGLAGLAGGSLASGGGGMVVGLGVCSGIIAVPALGLGLLTWAIAGSYSENALKKQYDAFCQRWRRQGYSGPS